MDPIPALYEDIKQGGQYLVFYLDIRIATVLLHRAETT